MASISACWDAVSVSASAVSSLSLNLVSTSLSLRPSSSALWLYRRLSDSASSRFVSAISLSRLANLGGQ